MRHFDLTPLYRSTVGFDRLFSLIDQVASHETQGYPPYNIEKSDENAYRVSLAVAGFGPDDLTVETRDGSLTVRGERKAKEGAEPREVLFQGIAARGFERRFQLADYVQVTGASLENGLLHIELRREVPEAKKPRLIPIGGTAPRTIEAVAA